MNSAIENVRFNFLYIDTYSFSRNWVFPESRVPFNMFRYIEHGSGTFFIDGEELTVAKDMIVYIPMGCRLSCYSNSDNFTFTSIRFTMSVSFEGGDFLTDYYHLPKIMEGKEEKKYFQEMYRWVKREDIGRMFFVRGNLELIIGALVEKANKNIFPDRKDALIGGEQTSDSIMKRIKKHRGSLDSRIQAVVDYIVLHPSEKYSPQKMADMADLSKQRFTALFSSQIGKSPMEYVRELKLTTAARRLLVSGLHVSDIAFEIGYDDPNYFIREFKKAFGYTPNQYRKVAKE